MKNLYLDDAYIREVQTTVIDMRLIKKKPAIILRENIFYPGGGGQPHDTGRVQFADGRVVSVSRVLKLDGKNYICLAETLEIQVNDPVFTTIDWERRYRLMRYHTAAHALMSTVRRNTENYTPEGIEIADDASMCKISFVAKWDYKDASAQKMISDTNNIIEQNPAVYSSEYGQLGDAITAFKEIYRGPITLSGSVRISIIDTWDANPCGGTHVKSLFEVGAIKLNSFNSDSISFSLNT